jgi:hypothetical protein
MNVSHEESLKDVLYKYVSEDGEDLK